MIKIKEKENKYEENELINQIIEDNNNWKYSNEPYYKRS